MRFTKLRILFATTCVIAMATVAFAATTSWTDLTEDQQQKYMALQNNFMQKTSTTRDALWAKRIELNALMNNTNVDAKAVADVAASMNTLRDKLRSERMAFATSVKNELGLNVMTGPMRGNHGFGCPGMMAQNYQGFGQHSRGMMHGGQRGMMRGMGKGGMGKGGMMRGYGNCYQNGMNAQQPAPAAAPAN
ncbi:MAG: periplasmic heavy metal sensor [Desulfovibrionales bacterium]|nr:periplasmic heavy metal sensor [Desulfovibrionales bacterium]